MKKLLSLYFLLFFSLQCVAIHKPIEYPIKGGDYRLESKIIKTFFIQQLPIVQLKYKGNEKAIATFQLPHHLELGEDELPQFSGDNKYLLILTAQWSLFYQDMPKVFEWHLFNLKQQKTIKKFPRQAKPQFSGDDRIVKWKQGSEDFEIPVESPKGFFENFFTTIKSFFVWQSPQKNNDSQDISSSNIVSDNDEPENETQLKQESISSQQQRENVRELIGIESSELPQQEIPSKDVEIKPIAPLAKKEDKGNTQEESRALILFKRVEDVLKFQPKDYSSAWLQYFFLKTLDFFGFIAGRKIEEQEAWIQEYLKTMQINKQLSLIKKMNKKDKAFYANQVRLLTHKKEMLAEGDGSFDQLYEQAVEILNIIKALSSEMSDEGDIEVINSPAVIDNFIQQSVAFCFIFINLPLEQQELLLKDGLVLIKKYYGLYEKIIKHAFLKSDTTSMKSSGFLIMHVHTIHKDIEKEFLMLEGGTVAGKKALKRIYGLSRKVDIFISRLPIRQQELFKKKQEDLVTTHKKAYQSAIKESVESGWKKHGTAIINTAGLLCATAITSALVGAASQGFQIGVGKASFFDTNLLMINAATAVFAEIIQVTQKLVRQLGIANNGFRLIINGGAYQEVPQVHWHLIAD